MNAIETKQMASLEKCANKLWIGMYTYFLYLIKDIRQCATWMVMIVTELFGSCSSKCRLACENAGEQVLLWQVSYP
jgi:hypothetical protein